MKKSAEYLIQRLRLQRHPEGGWFRETYRAAGGAAGRCHSTAIYFLLEDNIFSAFHRIRSDEIWHFYGGDGLEVHQLTDGGHVVSPVDADHPQLVVPGGTWFGARLAKRRGYALVGCTVAPGFEFSDFEMARRADLLSQFPAHADIIRSLTRS